LSQTDELNYKQDVVIPDLEQKLEEAIRYLQNTCSIVNKFELEKSDSDYIERMFQFCNENISYNKKERVEDNNDEFPF